MEAWLASQPKPVTKLMLNLYVIVCKMAESSTASNVDEPASREGHEFDLINIREEDLEVRVEGKELALRTTRKSYRAEANEVIFSLSVSNQLLFKWDIIPWFVDHPMPPLPH